MKELHTWRSSSLYKQRDHSFYRPNIILLTWRSFTR